MGRNVTAWWLLREAWWLNASAPDCCPAVPGLNLASPQPTADCQSSGGLPPGIALGCGQTSERGDRGEKIMRNEPLLRQKQKEKKRMSQLTFQPIFEGSDWSGRGWLDRPTIALQNVELQNVELQNAEFQNVELQHAELQNVKLHNVESYRTSNLTKHRNTKRWILQNVEIQNVESYRT